jgi:hypothetical protein
MEHTAIGLRCRQPGDLVAGARRIGIATRGHHDADRDAPVPFRLGLGKPPGQCQFDQVDLNGPATFVFEGRIQV